MKPVRAAVLLLVVAAPLQAHAAPADGVRWGPKEHRGTATLRAWLEDRGADYRVWAERHPAAAAWLEGRPSPPEPTTPTEAPARPASATSSNGAVQALVAITAGIGVLLVLASLTLSRRCFTVRYGRRALALRGALALAGTGLIVSVAVGYGVTLP